MRFYCTVFTVHSCTVTDEGLHTESFYSFDDLVCAKFTYKCRVMSTTPSMSMTLIKGKDTTFPECIL